MTFEGVQVGAQDAAAGDANTLAPQVAGPEGRLAFDELGTYYRDQTTFPIVEFAFDQLKSPKASDRSSAGRYLLALFKQSLADESNGRDVWQATPAWGRGGTSLARKVRRQVAERFGEKASASEAMDAACWLIEEDQSAENAAQGASVLVRIHSPMSVGAFERILRRPHLNEQVSVSILTAVGDRKLVELSPVVKQLSVHYRKAVRQAARKAASALEITVLPDYVPAKAFTPWLDEQFRSISGMITTRLPRDATWVRVSVTHLPLRENGNLYVEDFGGWLLSTEKDEFQFLDHFGTFRRARKNQTQITVSALKEEAARLVMMRKQDVDDGTSKALSRRGGLTAQFEPRFISLRETLVAAWCLERGDRSSAAAILFPRIDEAADDRWLGWATRDALGHSYHQEMLDEFSKSRDYDRAIALADHLSKPLFADYPYQDRAKKMASQLRRRQTDFVTLKLPGPQEWKELQGQLGREEQVRYLASRMRLLHCVQWGQPDGVSYRDPQTANAVDKFAIPTEPDDSAERVINPYVELLEMKLEIRELLPLVPYLAVDDFMLTYSYWRDFHPARTLHQANWAIASVFNDVAGREVVDLKAFSSANQADTKKYLATITKWCNDNAGKSRQ